jgi:tetratricopeptide (TPR) repeat protein
MPDRAGRWARVRELYALARQQPVAERETWLQAQSAAADVADEVRSLLAHAGDDLGEADDGFLAAPSLPWAQAAEPDEPDRTGQRLGDWQITGRLGAGGMGEVFEARRADGSYEGVAAVKLLKRGMDSAAVLQRFAQERQALARLSHPHIARLLDAGASDDGLPYFVLEHVAGRPIDEAVRGLPLEARLRLFLQLADAVAHAHRNLLVHRDLKPGNVLVDGDGHVKLLDFGIAKALDPLEGLDGHSGHTTVGGVRPYTPHYASPEQVRGEPVSTATDIYSLGVLLYQLLTGVRPTGRHATTPAEAARSVLEDTPTAPSRLSAAEAVDPQWLQTRRKLEGDLDNILLKALEKPPERRYASVDALAADVMAFLYGRPVSARAPGAAYVLGKFVRRNRWAVLAGALGGLGLATGLAAALLDERHAAALGVLGLAGGLGLALLQGRQAALARDEARRQLAGVKHITTELVFRYGDAISQLPGGARAQEAMLKQTINSLDVTLAIAPDDADLIVLVASALGRLAQIQGNPTFAGPERAAEASATVARALALAARAWPMKRHEWQFVSQHLITLLTHANMLRNRGQPAEGLAVLEQAEQRCAEALAERLSDVGRANVLELRANIATNMAHFNDHVGRPSLGRPQEALRWYGQAEQAFRALYGDATLLAAMNRATDPGSPPAEQWANHNIANVFVGRALVHQRLDDFIAMKRDVLAAIELRRDNLRRAPTSAIWRQSLMFDQNYLALALLQLGEAEAALAAAQSAWDTAAERLREEGPAGSWPATQGNFAVQYGRALAANGRHAEALPVYEIALRRAELLLQEGDTPRAREHLAALQGDRLRSLAALA